MVFLNLMEQNWFEDANMSSNFLALNLDNIQLDDFFWYHLILLPIFRKDTSHE